MSENFADTRLFKDGRSNDRQAGDDDCNDDDRVPKEWYIGDKNASNQAQKNIPEDA